MPNIIEFIRKEAVEKIFQTSFNSTWENSWRSQAINIIGNHPTARNIFNLGDNLGEIFLSTRGNGRSDVDIQSIVSSAGAQWEALVCWYLNICLVGTRVVVMKQSKKLVPTPINESIKVTYGNFPSNTEADLIAITFPNHNDYSNDINTFNQHNGLLAANIQPFNRARRLKYRDVVDFLSDRDFNDYEIGIIQCKTNWNDNAQIPMLWDMIYRAQGFAATNIHVGNNGYNISRLRKFTYSFVTVPTVARNRINAQSTQVKRVANLSGGNFWGYPTSNGIAKSIKEIFNTNFSNGTNGNILPTITNAIPNFTGNLSYFNL